MYYNKDNDCAYDEEGFYEFPVGQLNKEQFIHDLRVHQAGETGFLTWTEQTANSSITHWNLDLVNQVCTYYASEEKIYEENLKEQ